MHLLTDGVDRGFNEGILAWPSTGSTRVAAGRLLPGLETVSSCSSQGPPTLQEIGLAGCRDSMPRSLVICAKRQRLFGEDLARVLRRLRSVTSS